MAADFTTIDAAGARLAFPAHWSVLESPAAAIVALAIEPDDAWFRANVSLAATPQADLSFADWQNRTDVELPQVLDDYVLLDLEHVDVAGLPGGRRLAHYSTQDGIDVVMEQWSTVTAGQGWTLTWTVDVLRYDAFFDVVREATAALILPTGAGR